MPLTLIDHVEIPPGESTDFDHGDVHLASGMVFIAHTTAGSIEAVDPHSRRRVVTIPGCPEASGVLCAQAQGIVFAAARDAGKVLMIDAASYAGIGEIAVEAVAESRRLTLDPAVHALMTHYARMLRRHIVTDSETADLCRRIYERHQRALDLIFEHRPDRLAAVQAVLVDCVQAQADLILDTASKQFVRFGHVGWEGLPKGAGWTRSGRMVLFQFENYPDRLDLKLWIGPGPAEARRRVIDAAAARQPPFHVPERAMGKSQKFRLIYSSRRFLESRDLEEMSFEEIAERIRSRWAAFVEHDLPVLVVPLQEAAPDPDAES
jgi:hypothetical protein